MTQVQSGVADRVKQFQAEEARQRDELERAKKLKLGSASSSDVALWKQKWGLGGERDGTDVSDTQARRLEELEKGKKTTPSQIPPISPPKLPPEIMPPPQGVIPLPPSNTGPPSTTPPPLPKKGPGGTLPKPLATAKKDPPPKDEYISKAFKNGINADMFHLPEGMTREVLEGLCVDCNSTIKQSAATYEETMKELAIKGQPLAGKRKTGEVDAAQLKTITELFKTRKESTGAKPNEFRPVTDATLSTEGLPMRNEKDKSAINAISGIGTTEGTTGVVANEGAGVNQSFKVKRKDKDGTEKTVGLFKPIYAPTAPAKSAPCFQSATPGAQEIREVATSAWNELCGGLGDYPLTVSMKVGDQVGSVMAWRTGAGELSDFSPDESDGVLVGPDNSLDEIRKTLEKDGFGTLMLQGKEVRVSLDGRNEPPNDTKTLELDKVVKETEERIKQRKAEYEALVSKISVKDAHDLMSLHVATLQLDAENASNVMFTKVGEEVKPFAIDGGLSAPDKIIPKDVNPPVWVTWPQADKPWGDEQKAKFKDLNVADCGAKLKKIIDESPFERKLEQESLNRMMGSTLMLKIAADEGLTPKQTWDVLLKYLEDWVSAIEKMGPTVDFVTEFTTLATAELKRLKPGLTAGNVKSFATEIKATRTDARGQGKSKEETEKAKDTMEAKLKQMLGQEDVKGVDVKHTPSFEKLEAETREGVDKVIVPSVAKGLDEEKANGFVGAMESALATSPLVEKHVQSVLKGGTKIHFRPKVEAPYFDSGTTKSRKNDIIMPKVGEPADMLDGFLFETCNAMRAGEFAELNSEFFDRLDTDPLPLSEFGKRKAEVETETVVQHCGLMLDVYDKGGEIANQSQRNLADLAATFIKHVQKSGATEPPLTPEDFKDAERIGEIKEDQKQLEVFLKKHKKLLVDFLPKISSDKELKKSVIDRICNTPHNTTIQEPSSKKKLTTTEMYTYEQMEVNEKHIRAMIMTQLRKALGVTSNREIRGFDKIDRWINDRLVQMEVGPDDGQKWARQQVVLDILEELPKLYPDAVGKLNAEVFGFSEKMKSIAKARFDKMTTDSPEAFKNVKDRYPPPKLEW